MYGALLMMCQARMAERLLRIESPEQEPAEDAAKAQRMCSLAGSRRRWGIRSWSQNAMNFLTPPWYFCKVLFCQACPIVCLTFATAEEDNQSALFPWFR
jgi:hypothetical protein